MKSGESFNPNLGQEAIEGAYFGHDQLPPTDQQEINRRSLAETHPLFAEATVDPDQTTADVKHGIPATGDLAETKGVLSGEDLRLKVAEAQQQAALPKGRPTGKEDGITKTYLNGRSRVLG